MGVYLAAGDRYAVENPGPETLEIVSVTAPEEHEPPASRGVTVLDLMCDQRSYLPQNFSSDGFHPNDGGYAFMAAGFWTVALVLQLTVPYFRKFP